MKKVVFILMGILIMGIGVMGQDSTNPSLLRSSKAVKALNTVPYAQLVFADSAETIALTEDTWTEITNATNTLWTSTTARMTETADSIDIDVDGDYVAYLSVSYYATADDTIHVRLAKNDVGLTNKAEAVSIGGEVITLSVPYVIPDLDDGDGLKPQIQNSNNDDDAIVIDGSLVVYLIRYD